MREITEETAAAYLREMGIVSDDVETRVQELSGGVSNVVLKVDASDRPPFVIKQCRERLRVAMEWHARLDRIWAEHAALRLLHSILPPGAVPTILFEDRPNYLFAMTCAPDDSTTWKRRLMSGETDRRIAHELGDLLARIHGDSTAQPILHHELADTSLFDELRVDPYYRTTARAHPDLAPRFHRLIATMEELPISERTLVLGDFSPKNILVHSQGLILLDFECAHRGDPTFDLGFFLSHLILKSIHFGKEDPQRAGAYFRLSDSFWDAYLERIRSTRPDAEDTVTRAITQAAACLLARVDGKSPVEYLDETGKQAVRSLAMNLLRSEPETWAEVGDSLNKQLFSAARENR